jgi:hypothetical protein
VIAVGDKFFEFLRRLILGNKQLLDGTRSSKMTDVLNVEPAHSGFESLDGHKYMLLVTYKRNGDAVPMPVWFGRQKDRLFVWTEANAYKAKRLRNDERAIARQILLNNWGFFRKLFERGSRRITPVVYIELVPA